MSVQLNIPYETLVYLVAQLSPEQQEDLVHRVLAHQQERQKLSDQLLVFDPGPWPNKMSLRREDEYGDEGR
jgi:hypothetical protein